MCNMENGRKNPKVLANELKKYREGRVSEGTGDGEGVTD